MHKELDPSTVVRTSDFIGFSGLRVVIRELPNDGGGGSGRRGISSFTVGYRPGEQRGQAFVRFPGTNRPEVQMSRVSAIIPPDRPFEASYAGAAGKVASIYIEPRFLEDVVRRTGISPGKLEGKSANRFLINRRVDYLCSLLILETEQGGRLAPLYFEGLATALIVAVVGQTDSRLPDAGNVYVQNQHIQKAIAHIQANFPLKLTVSELATRSHLSTFHFSRLFNRLVGLPPSEYLLQYRLMVAEKLLSVPDSNLSIADVAADSGFTDQAQFSRHFRRYYGRSPHEYRRHQ
jgi:AraC-like DNA-binding protein